ncbi:exosortase T [Roseibium salinum]|uniref:Exosortase T n=1 Tax=Roseibium salinum TaxID=1604349 RepID=A0ABT3QZ43_9HYPH|nr:exosortase T [Roseibium sp. DSM 29163]MCX2722174.1 exosortase T [Roseibium sp. DSM 29163]
MRFPAPTFLTFALASLILAYEPFRWLIGSWFDPSYSSTGALYLVAIAALLARSLSSPVVRINSRSRQTAVILLAVSALIRLASQVLAINVIGGFALSLDIFALAMLLRTGERARPVSAFWLSVLFLFTLPVERILQRVIGYPLQELSARLSCRGLGLFFNDLSCSGIRIELAGKDVLVDLPCSGTSGLMLAMACLVILNVLYRPRLTTALPWFGIVLSLSLLGNALRISVLATGIAWPESFFGLDVMARPLHDMIGYLTLAVSMAPVLAFYRPRPVTERPVPPCLPVRIGSRGTRELGALVFLALALVIVALPRQALDVSAAAKPQALPASLSGEVGAEEELHPVEKRYFSQFGGHAQKKRYGPLALTLVHTSSPLRHLHAPDDCLRGLGYDVEFLGTRFDPVPTALYRARAVTGEEWRVAVTFTSSDGDVTHNIAEAIWAWLQKPSTTWTSVQRITPWTVPDGRRAALEGAVIAALDLHPTSEGYLP